MNENFQFLEIIFFAMVAIFILLRLRSLLGRRTGNEQSPQNEYKKDSNEGINNENNVVNINDINAQENDQNDFKVEESKFKDIKEIDPSFNENQFIEGAKNAYEMILTSFASGDLDTLSALLDDDVYDNFQQTIAEREAKNHSLETTLVSQKSAEVEEINLKNSIAEIKICFVSEVINVIRDDNDNIISGDPLKVEELEDYWTFARDLRSENINWFLVETSSDN